MKFYHIVLLVLVVNIQGVFAQQSGTINYSEVTKLELKGLEDMGLGDMMPNEMSASKTLYFDRLSSVYRDADDHEDEDIELSSDDGSFQIVIGSGSAEEILYINLKDKESLYQTSFMDKDFLIFSDVERLKWKITNERIKYLGYVCQKATMTETIPPAPGIDEPEQQVEVVAWFTTEIPVSIGPSNYNQLPGAILMISVDEGKTEIKATSVNMQPPSSEKLQKPTQGQKVTQEEYESILEEKMKEMEEMYGDNERSIMIRG